MSRFRKNVENLHPYVPGEQPEADADVIKLNTNENPYPPSPRAVEALRTIGSDLLRRYPQPLADVFRDAVGKTLNFDPSWVLAGNGSDDLLTQLIRAVVEPGRPVAYPTPTYVLYRTLAEIQDAPTEEVPYNDNYDLPIDALSKIDAPLTIIANPNSPSGTVITIKELQDLADRLQGILAIDEAYVGFSNSSAIELTRQSDRIIVLRTLSKSHGLAGLRLGFAVAQPSLLSGLTKVKDSYNVDAVAAYVGTAAIQDINYSQDVARRIVASRGKLIAAMTTLGFHVWPSQANFILVRHPHAAAGQLYETLKAQGILVRYFAEPKLSDTLRITVGTDDQNDQLLKALTSLLSS